MTTPNTDALLDDLAGALTTHWQRKHSTLLTSGPCSGCTRAILPIVEAAVKAGQAEALRDAATPDWGNDNTWWSGPRVRRKLTRRADTIEKEAGQ